VFGEAELVRDDRHAAHDEELAAHRNGIAGRVLSQFLRNQVLAHVVVRLRGAVCLGSSWLFAANVCGTF
jgi:hypothetical protein